MKCEWMKGTFAFLMFLAVLSVVGFFNCNTLHIKPISELALDEIEYVYLPFDLKRFPDSVLSCKARNNQITIVTLKAAAELKVKRGTPIEKILEKQHITGKQGVINLPVDCFIKAEGLTIKKDDILIGEGFLQDTPSLVNENSKKIKNNTLIIYNTSLNDTEFKVESFLEDGTKTLEKTLKVRSFSFKTLKTKGKTAKTYRITPQSKGASYLAINRELVAGKVYISKPLKTFSNAIISPKKGVLVVSNVTSAPATFRYIVTKNGEKRYEGKEWLLPYSQRKISLAKLKSLKNAKMEITPISYYYPKVCNEDGKCYRDESRKDNTIVANYYNGKTFSAITNSEGTFSDEIRYKNKVNKALPVSCKIDNVAKPYCDKDSNGNGIDDAEELFHYFANPEMEDADEDGFSNREEIEAGTKAFHPFDFPGAPKDDTVDGMFELAKLIEGKQDTQKRVLGSSTGVNRLFEVMANAFLKPGSQVESIINSIDYKNPNNLIDNICNGVNICISDYNLSSLEYPENAYFHFSDRVAGYLEGCINVMGQVVGRIAGDDCRYCKVEIEQNSEKEGCANSDLRVDIETVDDGRSYNDPIDGRIVFNPNSIKDDPLHTVCHELGHAFFNVLDRYAEDDFDIPSLYASFAQDCLTSYDVFILQIVTIRQMTGLSVSEIIAKTESCITTNGKIGKIISGYGGGCLEDWTTEDYRKNPRLYCPPNGQNGVDTKFPEFFGGVYNKRCYCNEIEDDNVTFCCENETDVVCKVSNDSDEKDCCTSGCNSDGACADNKTPCGKFEVEYTDSEGNNGCCPTLNAIIDESNGKAIECCSDSGDLIACGDSCCRMESCLESENGKKCCPDDVPFACLDAIGSINGCCANGCLSGSNYSNRMCACGDGEYAASVLNDNGYQSYIACCPFNTFYNQESKECEDCPDGTISWLSEDNIWECMCGNPDEGFRPLCGDECCTDEQICIEKNGHKECKKCESGARSIVDRESKIKKVLCNCRKGEEPCNDNEDCCTGDNVCEGSYRSRKGIMECKQCPLGSVVIKTQETKYCICKETYELPCGGVCCKRDQRCVVEDDLSICQDCPEGSRGCADVCCSDRQACKYDDSKGKYFCSDCPTTQIGCGNECCLKKNCVNLVDEKGVHLQYCDSVQSPWLTPSPWSTVSPHEDCRELNECVLEGCEATKDGDCIGTAFSSMDCVDTSIYNPAKCVEQLDQEGNQIVCCSQEQRCLECKSVCTGNAYYDEESGACKCPDGQERKENRCICSETKFETCNGECCPKDQVCSFVDGKRKCVSCDDEQKPCFDKCCEKDEICEVSEIFGSMIGICSRSFSTPMISDSPFSPSLTPDFSPKETISFSPSFVDSVTPSISNSASSTPTEVVSPSSTVNPSTTVTPNPTLSPWSTVSPHEDCRELNECVLEGCEATKDGDCIGTAYSSMDCVDRSLFSTSKCVEQNDLEGNKIVCCLQS